MTFDRQTREDIVRILNTYLGKDSIVFINQSLAEDEEQRLNILIKNPDAGVPISLKDASEHYENLASACSALATFCEDRKLDGGYSPRIDKFTIMQK